MVFGFGRYSYLFIFYYWINLYIFKNGQHFPWSPPPARGWSWSPSPPSSPWASPGCWPSWPSLLVSCLQNHLCPLTRDSPQPLIMQRNLIWPTTRPKNVILRIPRCLGSIGSHRMFWVIKRSLRIILKVCKYYSVCLIVKILWFDLWTKIILTFEHCCSEMFQFYFWSF